MRPLPYEQVKVTPKPQIDLSAYKDFKQDRFFSEIRFWGFITVISLVGLYAVYRLIKIYFFGG